MPLIYLAGKVAANDWRHEAVYGLRGAWPDDTAAGPDPKAPWPVLPAAVVNFFDYAGPYFISCDHRCAHGSSTHGVGYDGNPVEEVFPTLSRRQVRDRCLEAIRRSDLVFAWVDDLTAYGTLVELGYAHAHDKTIVIATPWEQDQERGKHADELWFAFECASEIIRDRTPQAALRALAARYHAEDGLCPCPLCPGLA